MNVYHIPKNLSIELRSYFEFKNILESIFEYVNTDFLFCELIFTMIGNVRTGIEFKPSVEDVKRIAGLFYFSLSESYTKINPDLVICDVTLYNLVELVYTDFHNKLIEKQLCLNGRFPYRFVDTKESLVLFESVVDITCD